MKDKFFIDTNIFIYSFDSKEHKKRQKSRELIEEALKSGRGVISTQVVQEFINAALKKLTPAMTQEECLLYYSQVLQPLCEFYPSHQHYKEAIGLKFKTGYSFYDSLILAAALASDCHFLLTEDLQDGQKIGNLSIKNPFRSPET